VTAGRQLVDGVAGTRPGGRGGRGGIDGVGRWVGERLDWLLDEGDDWREPWQERSEPAVAAARPPADGRRQAGEGRSDGGGRRALEAISRRGRAPADGDWPADDDFTIPRWQRSSAPPEAGPEPVPGSTEQLREGGRPVPRSSRRRQS
jgi:hypothetical protein